MMCSTTNEIQASDAKTRGLERFYRTFLREIERTCYGINTCGAEPLRRVSFERYCELMYTTPSVVRHK